jgi:hypothetical protein
MTEETTTTVPEVTTTPTDTPVVTGAPEVTTPVVEAEAKN